MSVPKSRDTNDVNTIVNPAQMNEMFREKMASSRDRILGKGKVEVRGEFVATTRGCVLTTNSAIDWHERNAKRA